MRVAHLYECSEHTATVARWIHNEWWRDKPGHTPETMAARLREASDPERIPLSLVALVDEKPVGTVNLVENDDERRPHLSPWLAALLVLPDFRGQGIGTRLVREVVAEARRLRVNRLYLGTDIPRYYESFGAEIHERVTEEFCIMRLDVGPTP